MKHLLRLSILFLVLGGFVTCEKEEINQPPDIQNINASPQVVKPGEEIQLTCIATDPDGDQLYFSWSSSSGTFPNGNDGSSVSWQAPNDPSSYTISVIVKDGQNVAESNINVEVEANPQLFVFPIALDFGTEETEKWVEIKNTGTGSLSWSVREDIKWLSVDFESGETKGETDKITLTVSRDGLVPGNYKGAIFIFGNGGTQNVIFSMDVKRDSNIITGTFFDSRDAHQYNWVKIGDQIWMAENLAYLPVVNLPSAESYTEPYYYVYHYSGTDVTAAKETSNYKTYGVLYNWPAAKAACPAGWHLPTDDEWKQLEMTIGMSQSEADDSGSRGTNEGTKLKAYRGWGGINYNGTDDFGFSALPGGYRYGNGSFFDINDYGYWWSFTQVNSNTAWYRYLYYDVSSVSRVSNNYSKAYGLSVRCVRD